MKKIVILLVLAAFNTLLYAQQYSKVKIYTNEHSLKEIAQLGIAVDHGIVKKGLYFITDLSDYEIQKLKNAHIPYDILIADVVKFYQERNKKAGNDDEKQGNNNCNETGINYPTPANFTLGSMGGFFTYAEILNHLDAMQQQFPNLITVKQPIDTFQSHEGRPVYWLKISDNPTVDENEPEILFTALHHAREPASVSQMIMFMWYLLENYAVNPEIQQMVDNTEIYFIPCINPDGYIYNETTNPNGGGMWRKNRRDNNDGTYGVDLNRNYGYMFGLDNTGSSPNTNDDTYRGPSAFSEPETQAVKYFEENHNFGICVNYHTYGNLLIYPWGYAPSIYTPDSAIYVEYAQLMTRYNHYSYGTGDQTVGYVTNGDSDDWGYGEQTTKNKVLSMTPEAGDQSDGFWPAQNRIIDVCKDNLYQNLMAVKLVGKYAKTSDITPQSLASLNGYLKFNIKRLGLDSPSTFTVSLQPISANISAVGNPKSFTNLSLLQTKTDSIAYTLNTSVQNGDIIKFLLVTDNGLYTETDTLIHVYGQGNIVLNDNATNLNNWSTTSWNVTTAQYYSPSSSITDSPNGNYGNNSYSEITFSNFIDLTNAGSATLSFWAKWSIENDYDFVEVQASADGGNSWVPLCGKYTNPGTSNQDANQPLYDGVQATWVKEEISLDDFLGFQITIRFVLQSDFFVTDDGFYFDDLMISVVNDTITTVSSLESNNSVLSVYPNPATNVLNISNVKTNNLSFILYNANGQIVLKNNIETNTSIEITNLQSGLYFYTVQKNGAVMQKGKVLKL
jgi:hypothetical protein